MNHLDIKHSGQRFIRHSVTGLAIAESTFTLAIDGEEYISGVMRTTAEFVSEIIAMTEKSRQMRLNAKRSQEA